MYNPKIVPWLWMTLQKVEMLQRRVIARALWQWHQIREASSVVRRSHDIAGSETKRKETALLFLREMGKLNARRTVSVQYFEREMESREGFSEPFGKFLQTARQRRCFRF
jgi:hypothetical protein